VESFEGDQSKEVFIKLLRIIAEIFLINSRRCYILRLQYRQFATGI
jgi:hypothetical protein